MAYTGNWLKSARQVQANPTALPEPTAEHGQSVGDQYPQDHQAPPGADYGDADFARTVVQTPGMPLDAPDRSNQSEARGGAYRNQLERQAIQSRGHEGQDRGWVRSAWTGRAAWQDDTTRYMESSWTGNGSPAPPPEAIQRSGLNSLPQNNPERPGYDPGGYRRGLRFRRFVDRKNRIDPRVYTAQQLLARQISVPTNQPAQNGTWGRTSPFASLARNLSTVGQQPALFRSPPSLTDTVIADAPVNPEDGGIATDGMWAVT